MVMCTVQSVPFALPLLCAVSQIDCLSVATLLCSMLVLVLLFMLVVLVPFGTLTQLLLRLLRRPRRCRP